MSTTPSVPPRTPLHIHLHLDATPGTNISFHLNTNAGQQPSDYWDELVNNIMVDEMIRHPQQDFSQDLAYKLGVGDLFEGFLMEQSSVNKTSKEKVEVIVK